MIRKIVHIDEEKCSGCGLCADACHENAIVMQNGKAHLLKDDYCDGLGDCLPACPSGAITIEERESAAYNPEAVEKRKFMLEGEKKSIFTEYHSSCPGTAMHTFKPLTQNNQEEENNFRPVQVRSCLMQWPVQIKLLPVNAPFFDNANLLIAADCTAYAYAAFHQDFIKNHITLIGCPKLDDGDYSEKLTRIIASNNIKSLTIVRMEVPCCGGLERAAKEALQLSGKFIPWRLVVISSDGRIVEE